MHSIAPDLMSSTGRTADTTVNHGGVVVIAAAWCCTDADRHRRPRQQKWTEKAHLTAVQSMLDSQREVLARLSTNDQ